MMIGMCDVNISAVIFGIFVYALHRSKCDQMHVCGCVELLASHYL